MNNVSAEQLADLATRVDRVVNEFCAYVVIWLDSDLKYFPESWIRVGKNTLVDCFRLAILFETDLGRREALRTSLVGVSDFLPHLSKPYFLATLLPAVPDRSTTEFESAIELLVQFARESETESKRLFKLIQEVEVRRDDAKFVRALVSRGIELVESRVI